MDRKKRRFEDNRQFNAKRRPPPSVQTATIPSIYNFKKRSSKISLKEIKSKLKSKDLFFWDKTPPNYKNINLKALKLFGLATPQTDFTTQEIPPDFQRFTNVRSLSTSKSVIFRTLNNTVYPNLEKCALTYAQNENMHRPPVVAGALKQINYFILENAERILLNKNTIVYPISATKQPDFEQLQIISSIDLNGEFRASELKSIPPNLPENVKCLYVCNGNCKMVVEVLNALPLNAQSAHEQKDTLELLKTMCLESGFATYKVSIVEKPIYELTRVFIELLDENQCVLLAEELGGMKIDGRRLITTTTFMNMTDTEKNEQTT